ncbi:restriction endonuclease subunit S [Rhodopseudomonas parapalustris]
MVPRQLIIDNCYDLAPAVYLSGYHLPANLRTSRLGDLFDVNKGNAPAAESGGGDYVFATTAAELKRHHTFAWDNEAIIIPTVSSTGHGHASIKNIHYVNGKFSAATITAVLTPRADKSNEVCVLYVYFYLLTHKEQVLVPQMRGAANVSLSLERIRNLRIPLPGDRHAQEKALKDLDAKRREINALNSQLALLQSEWQDELIRFGSRF